MARILVTEEIAQGGLDRLRLAGHEVDVQTELSREQFLAALPGVNALIIRSATNVDAEAVAAAPDLQVVGRAGVGLDNVDVEAATNRGVMVVNAPTSNIISAAEQTMALLLSIARNVPQAHAALVAGRWERSKWEGVELAEKTLGIVGLGRIGKLVAERAAGFAMQVIAYDPYISEERAREMGVEAVSLDELVARADFLTVHLPKTKETIGLIGRDLLKKAKPELRVINVARGGIVDEEALYEALKNGVIAGAALDVFNKEPTTESPLFTLPNIVVAPHLGASTREAQDKAGDTIADMMLLALAGDFVPFAVNVNAAEANETIKPFLPLAERLGRLFASLIESDSSKVTTLEINAAGEIGGYDIGLLSLSAQKGYFGANGEEQVTYVNAPQIAKQRGVEVKNSTSKDGTEYKNLVTIRGGGHSIAATLTSQSRHARIVMIDDHVMRVPPSENMLIVRNDDRPGVIGLVGVTLGAANVNIEDMDVGRADAAGTAMMVMATNTHVPDEVVSKLAAEPGIIQVARLHL